MYMSIPEFKDYFYRVQYFYHHHYYRHHWYCCSHFYKCCCYRHYYYSTIIGICPYLGIRNYPALAMFSNLRTEGNSPNHLVLPSLNILNFQKDTVTIYSTNLRSLKNYQINLALYFTKHSIEFNNVLGISNEFWITPPAAAWSEPDNKLVKFIPYSIPLLELRKHVSNQLSQKFYINFSFNHENETLTFDSRIYHEKNENRSHFYDLFITPVSVFERIAFRFRSFDSSYSPCRH